jgi:hypothetical protein
LVERRFEAGEPSAGPRKTVAIDVEQGEAMEWRGAGAVEKEASADSGLEMIGGEIGAIEFEKTLCATTPSEAVGEPVHQTS